ncbi:MAG TPA: AAA family ATPase [Candidatus Nanoarchaeia archaeon]|nr:AAA family ATPase [Candidatus Nanoarchaeia archaeon]
MGSLFKDILGSNESLFKNDVSLDYSFMPKMIPFREKEQRIIANCMKPLFDQKNGRNAFVYGQPGVGKTVALKKILEELESETDEIIPVYINCWKHNTTFKIFTEACEMLDFKFIQNKKTEELFKMIKQVFNKKSVVFVFDEADKLEDLDFLYMIMEEIYRKTIILITNYREWVTSLEDRIKSRLMPEMIEFRPYNYEETKGILKQRAEYAFHPGVLSPEAFELIAKKTSELQDMRTGLHLMKEAALIAENKSSRKISLEHAQQALDKVKEFSINNPLELGEDEQSILEMIKNNSGKKIGEYFKIYQDNGGKLVYKSFQRKVEKLEQGRFVTLEKISGGSDGTTTIIRSASEKKLTDF